MSLTKQQEKIFKYNKRGELIAEYDSIISAARDIEPDGTPRELKSISTGISRAIRQGGLCEGFLWARGRKTRKDYYD